MMLTSSTAGYTNQILAPPGTGPSGLFHASNGLANGTPTANGYSGTPNLSFGTSLVGACNPLTSSAVPSVQTPQIANTASLEGVPIYLVQSGGQPYATMNPGGTTLAFLPKIQDVKAHTTPPSPTPKVDTSKHYHIFVGDLSPEIDNKLLKEGFASFGDVSDAKVIRDMQTLKSKGYGFVSFINKEEAQRAIDGMNGQWLGRRVVRTNWATRKPQQPTVPKPLSYDEVFSQAGPQNTTVYVGNTNATTTEQHLRDTFSKYGIIQEIRIFKQQGYCFVRYETKESACNSIVNLSGVEVNGAQIRCSWGREDGGKSSQTTLAGLNLGTAGLSNYNSYWSNYYNYYTNQALASANTSVVTPQLSPTVYQQMLQNLQVAQQPSAASTMMSAIQTQQPQLHISPHVPATAYFAAQ